MARTRKCVMQSLSQRATISAHLNWLSWAWRAQWAHQLGGHQNQAHGVVGGSQPERIRKRRAGPMAELAPRCCPLTRCHRVAVAALLLWLLVVPLQQVQS
jgi:hypothetical protein